jgi:RNA polymerase sigma factor (sigma-70 family)
MNQTIVKPTLEQLVTDSGFKKMIEALAYRTIMQYRSGNTSYLISKKDLVSEAIAAACAAYANFDPARGAWTTYTYLYALNAMQTYCKKFSHPLSISEKDARTNLPYLGSIGIMRIDQQIDNTDEGKFDIPVGSGVEIVEEGVVDEYLRGFSHDSIAMLKEHILEGKTLYQIGIKYGMSKSKVYNIIHKMMDRVKERVENEQNDQR